MLADSKLLADFFIDSADVGGIQKFHPEPNTAAGRHGNPSSSTAGGPAADSELAKTFSAIRSMITEGVVKSIQAVYIFDLKGCVLVRYYYPGPATAAVM